MKKIALLLAVLLVFTMAACTSEPELTLGTYDGNSYSNEFFGISYDIPETFTILSADQTEELLGQSFDKMIEDGTFSESEVNLAEEKSLYYTAAFANPLNYIDGFNSNIMILSENLSLLEKALVSDGKDYLEYTKSLLEDTGVGYEFDEIESIQIDGKQFYKLPASVDYGIMVYQEYYAAIINNHAFAFILSYGDDAQKAELTTIIDSVKFKD